MFELKKNLVFLHNGYVQKDILLILLYRVFCFFDKGRLVVLINGFQKKTQKTPKNEIELAEKIKKEYFDEKN